MDELADALARQNGVLQQYSSVTQKTFEDLIGEVERQFKEVSSLATLRSERLDETVSRVAALEKRSEDMLRAAPTPSTAASTAETLGTPHEPIDTGILPCFALVPLPPASLTRCEDDGTSSNDIFHECTDELEEFEEFTHDELEEFAECDAVSSQTSEQQSMSSEPSQTVAGAWIYDPENSPFDNAWAAMAYECGIPEYEYYAIRLQRYLPDLQLKRYSFRRHS